MSTDSTRDKTFSGTVRTQTEERKTAILNNDDNVYVAMEDRHSTLSLEYVRTLAVTLVNDELFKRGIVILIILNSIWMGIATFDFVTENPSVDRAFEIVDHLFLWIFTIELGLQFCHHGLELFSDGWLIFDFFVIVLSWAFEALQVLRAFRILRALRLMSQVKKLRHLIQVLTNVIPHVFAIFALLLLIYYVFAVIFTSLFKQLYRDGLTAEDYFSRLDTTLFTLFQLMTMDSWSQITKEVMETYQWAWLPIISFIVVSSFVVVNLVIGVICDAVASMQQAQSEEELKAIQSMTSQAKAAEHDDFLRMEYKMDQLVSSVAALMEQQRILQDEVRRLKSSEAS